MVKRGLWYLDGDGIRRPIYRNGKQSQERYPIKKYRHLIGNQVELEKLIVRLNQPTLAQRAKAAVKIKHAFIDEPLLEEYKAELIAQSPSRERALCEFHYLYQYFLLFFIGQQNLPNPVDWHRVHKTVWAEYLREHPNVKASSTKREVVQAANAFMEWLHNRRPDEVPPLKFHPLSTEVYKKIRATREMNGEARDRKYIPLKDWEKIREKLGDLAPYVHLAACYGLRRAEVLGLNVNDVAQNYLNVERQLERLTPTPEYGPLKGREARKVEHWYMSPDQATEWIEDIQKALMHPDTLTERWKELMTDLGMKYDFHDLRHTFITLAVRDYKSIDVMHSAGHKSLTTTEKYIHDDRQLDDDEIA